MSDNIKKELDGIIKRQIERIDNSYNILADKIGYVDSKISYALSQSTIELEQALALIKQAIDADKITQRNLENQSTTSQKNIKPISYKSQETTEQNKDKKKITIEEIEKKQKNNKIDLAQALTNPSSISIIEDGLQESIDSQQDDKEEEDDEQSIAEIIEEEEVELSPFAIIQAEIDKQEQL